MSSLFKVKPSGLGMANTDTSWEVVEMQNLGDINPYLPHYVLWYSPFDFLKAVNS